MWYLPLSITLEMKKTKTGWQVTHRVHFIHQEREGGASSSSCSRNSI